MGYDVTFLGHMSFNEIVPFNVKSSISPGGAMFFSASVPARLGKKTALVVKMADRDKHILEPMEKLGVETYVIPSNDTTYIKVIYPTEDIDNREFILQKDAGFIKSDEVPKGESKCLHLAGISNTEFNMDLIKYLRKKYSYLSIDMQSIVRHMDKNTRKISFEDDDRKKEIASLMNGVKLDIVEAQILTGTDDIEKAAITFEKWGCPEVMVTHSKGVLVRAFGKTYYEKFTSKNFSGRTGRGDTTFAAYLTRRLDHDVADSVKFAAALVSIKMETPGYFNGKLEDVLLRMRNNY